MTQLGLNVAAIVIGKRTCACPFNAQRFACFNGFVIGCYTCGFVVTSYFEACIGGICYFFQLIFGRCASAGNRCGIWIPSDVGQACYVASCAVNFHGFATCCSIAYGNGVRQFEADFVVFNSGHNVAVTCVFNSFSQLNGVGCAVVGSNLEAVFFQIVQLAAVDGFFAACSNVAIRYTSNFVAAIIQTILS